MKNLFFQKVPRHEVPRWYQALAYHDPRIDRYIMVLYPFHWMVNLAWWLNLKWSKHRCKPSWIDKMMTK